MNINIKRVSDKAVPEMQPSPLPPNLTGLLGTPDQGPRHKKPRDSFAVMRMRNQKHPAIGIIIPEK